MTGSPPFVFDKNRHGKRHAPATERNRSAIAHVLCSILPSSGFVLEVASGTGEHAVHFAREFPNLVWQPSDAEPAGLESIAAWREEARLSNLLPPIELDVSVDWPALHADAIVCINMVHISPWEATLGLFRGAAKVLTEGGPLYLYGPYLQEAVPTAKSNEDFDSMLRLQNPAWGLRHLERVSEAAEEFGFRLQTIVEMPANNLSVVFHN